MNPDARGLRILAEATEALRVHTPSGWHSVRSDLLAVARRAHRPSAPVRGAHDLGEYFLAGDVLAARLRAGVDSVPDAAATAVNLRVTVDDLLQGVTVEVAALFGSHLPTVAEEVRSVVGSEVDDLLGRLSPGPAGIEVHVHVGDVVQDPVDLG